VVGLLLFYIFSRFAIRKMLRPLRRLTESAYSIAEGNYATMVPDTDRDDEVGMFQHNFKLMQDNLLADIQKQDNLKDNLHERREALRKAHEQIQEDDRVQTTFLHNVTNRLIPPSESILGSVSLLSDNYQFISRQEAQNEVINIKNQSDMIFDLLIKKFKASYNKEEGKEDKK
jgi:methyl-accepting chemotaxis protein/sigma-B regulation protein RsbU (phosphoserine phosphatase)